MSNPVATGTILDQILAQTAIDLEIRRRLVPFVELEAKANSIAVAGSLREAIARPGTSVIAEFKRASPSKGTFPVEMTPVGVASEYVAGGAVAISVLTDGPFFKGTLNDLTEAAAIAHAAEPVVAILRKDFILDEYQILEAKVTGADAILLIVGSLDQATLRCLYEFTYEIGLEALVEVHDRGELDRADEIGARIIGVNNRDLRTFTVDLAVTESLADNRPAGALLVSESGIFTRDDVTRLEHSGVDAILVGESIVLSEDRVATIKTLRGVSG